MSTQQGKIYKVWYRGERVPMSYEEICERLGGYIASIGFVRVTSAGTIAYTCGRPEEIKALCRDAKDAGFVPAKSMER